MVYGFVKQSNGHVQIYSEPGQGTTVKIYLPRTREEPPVDTLWLETPDGGDGQVILVVEDDAEVRAAAIGLLEGLGYRCLQAHDARSGLAMVEAHPEIDLVFCDVVMPGEMKTREFAERLRVLRPATPILFTSGYTQNAIVHQGRLDDGVHLLSKPYALDDLARKIAELLRRPVLGETAPVES
jgi:CheY-like chemotaxis protein